MILTDGDQTAQIKYLSVFFLSKNNDISKFYLKLVINVDIKVSSVHTKFILCYKY